MYIRSTCQILLAIISMPLRVTTRGNHAILHSQYMPVHVRRHPRLRPPKRQWHLCRGSCTGAIRGICAISAVAAEHPAASKCQFSGLLSRFRLPFQRNIGTNCISYKPIINYQPVSTKVFLHCRLQLHKFSSPALCLKY